MNDATTIFRRIILFPFFGQQESDLRRNATRLSRGVLTASNSSHAEREPVDFLGGKGIRTRLAAPLSALFLEKELMECVRPRPTKGGSTPKISPGSYVILTWYLSLNVDEMSRILKPWRSKTWYLIDARGNVRACIRRCLRTEAQALAPALFGETMRALRLAELTDSQRAQIVAFPALTRQRCKDLFGIEPPVDTAERKARIAAARLALDGQPKTDVPSEHCS